MYIESDIEIENEQAKLFAQCVFDDFIKYMKYQKVEKNNNDNNYEMEN